MGVNQLALYDDVYGITYQSAKKQMDILHQEIVQQGQAGGFADKDELIKWAHDHLLDKVVYKSMQQKFFYLSHKGELLVPQSFADYYKNLLYYTVQNGRKTENVPWLPDGFEYYDAAYVASEQTDGIHRPLYFRSYVLPTGFYSVEKDAFNVAKSFEVFAKETGRDTSYIYIYIEHIAGECAMWLLAWLRAKLLYPTVKTQVIPIIISRAQGSGKTTFAEVICKGLFGRDNVLVTDQYDSQARFNSDYADALIICQEEKEETDRRNPAGALKSRATATTIRKEQKGVDPIYQESYTDFIMTTNKDVPVKFDGREDQRRFMVMSADEHFTRKDSALADEVFTKLYGYDANFQKKGTPFVEDTELIQQFKHELFSRADIAEVPLRNFPKTVAYKRCFTLPRTSEATEIEGILRAIMPFIKQSLEQGKLIVEIGDSKLLDVVQYPGALQYMPEFGSTQRMVALCRPLVFYEAGNMKPYTHSTVERALYDSLPWIRDEYNLTLCQDMEPLPGGFIGVAGRYKMAPAARFCRISDIPETKYEGQIGRITTSSLQDKKEGRREGKRLRVNDRFQVDGNGCFETVNEMPLDCKDLKDKSRKVLYMDTFLLESDTPTHLHRRLEQERLDEAKDLDGSNARLKATFLYKERLQVARSEAERMFQQGIACRIVYSGAKSFHTLVRVADSPKTLEEYAWLHGYLCNSLSDKVIFDESTCDPGRLTRSPVQMSRVSVDSGVMVEGEQNLLAVDFTHIYNIDWRELYDSWCKRPLKSFEKGTGRRVMPTRPEYREAVQAISDGTFWTDSKWDGERQRCFFAAYRLFRLLGYEHNDLWDGGIMYKGVENYKHPDEIGYWKSRGKSSIVLDIDAQIDEYNTRYQEEKNV